MNLFFKPPVDIEILFDKEDSRKHVEVLPASGSHSKVLGDSLPVYEDGESISGNVTVRVREGKIVEHLGIKVTLIGSIDLVKAAGNSTSNSYKSIDVRKRSIEQFICMTYDLSPAGELNHSQSFPFKFKDMSMQFESYRGKNVDVSYYIKVTVMKKGTDISKIKPFWVYLYKDLEEVKKIVEQTKKMSEQKKANGIKKNDKDDKNSDSIEKKPIKLDIGIENCLHIEFEYTKSIFSLKDVIVGRIYFLLTRLKIKHMELSLITRESSGLQQSNTLVDSTAIRYEIMDGSPVKGETIPIRLFMSGYDLTPSISCNYFDIKNYLSLVIIDEDGRRYFKQSEIKIYRSK
ncbi:hypothetical protein TPHA_0I02620 [Tetrapisispora phaffii CBS 4417]|uniref:Vacuolar protein sorting-associated protein 26 n=1 Tax=Tetrapisispora phaffii (strain ATCC 24235 / CBS 4417 / NBRC 1672 / NRRL Y-8282 / UCD 70-5) TaxID=1071381 RepID=G8BXY5_TETPH|nr:hypothetical protein TPHA_0I02620 [Tetrapisispora phaffii CBS 4417]CCE64763.1 hypothetical protein TPHA_0I02620 [Tetrapisispora phaffii CBS 4417]